jgi:hypothetical protein
VVLLAPVASFALRGVGFVLALPRRRRDAHVGGLEPVPADERERVYRKVRDAVQRLDAVIADFHTTRKLLITLLRNDVRPGGTATRPDFERRRARCSALDALSAMSRW